MTEGHTNKGHARELCTRDSAHPLQCTPVAAGCSACHATCAWVFIERMASALQPTSNGARQGLVARRPPWLTLTHRHLANTLAGPDSEELPYTEEFFLPGSGASRGLTSSDLEASRTQTWDDATATVSIDDVDKPGPHSLTPLCAAPQAGSPAGFSLREAVSAAPSPEPRSANRPSRTWPCAALWRRRIRAALQGLRRRSCRTRRSSSCPAAAPPAA
jgi:hypothetical protein